MRHPGSTGKGNGCVRSLEHSDPQCRCGARSWQASYVALSMAWHRTLALHGSIVARRNLAFLPLAQAILFPRCPQALPTQLPQKPPGRALAPKIAFSRLLAHGQHGYAKIDGDSPLGMLDFLDVVGTHQDQGKPPLRLSADRHTLTPAVKAHLLTHPHPANAGKPEPRDVDTKDEASWATQKRSRTVFFFRRQHRPCPSKERPESHSKIEDRLERPRT
ncbi:hypothetical protein MPNT_10167 [Candidatus Methylacidithermus pantelleriae]|uniref:Uncharacterized protein n=1 Tax=Candidatus Methylacidithermus pantelleriae TaxID=2744239 RepID=A0A8J2FUX4_9BACT|nr:hypothetical protein MPNT_10167 [Candidatus Methylacidithermus pantelleriae]